jgi:hypothetical protein
MCVYIYGLLEALWLWFPPRDFSFTIEATLSLEKISNYWCLTKGSYTYPFPVRAMAERVPEMWRILIFVAGLFRTGVRAVDRWQCSLSLLQVQ